jgi:hypothetical protein
MAEDATLISSSIGDRLIRDVLRIAVWRTVRDRDLAWDCRLMMMVPMNHFERRRLEPRVEIQV